MDNFEWLGLKYVLDAVKHIFLFKPHNNPVI